MQACSPPPDLTRRKAHLVKLPVYTEYTRLRAPEQALTVVAMDLFQVTRSLSFVTLVAAVLLSTEARYLIATPHLPLTLNPTLGAGGPVAGVVRPDS